MLKILIPESIPGYNKGEEAIFRGILKSLEFVPEKKIYLYSEDPEYDRAQYAGDAEIITRTFVPNPSMGAKKKFLLLTGNIAQHLLYLFCPPPLRKVFFKSRLWRIYEEMDLVILGHDNAFSFSHNFLILFCKILRKKTVFYGGTIHEHNYRSFIKKKVTRSCLAKLDLITMRERGTFRFLKGLGLESPFIKSTADLAFLLEPVDRVRALGLLKESGIDTNTRPLVGMTAAVNSIVYKRSFIDIKDPRKKYETHARILAGTIDFLVENIDATVVLFVHAGAAHRTDSDRKVTESILERVADRSRVFLTERDYSASELKGMIGCTDLFIGERVHSVLAALSMKVPSVVLSNTADLRAYGIIGEMLEQSEWIYNTEHPDPDFLKELVMRAWKSREATRRKLEVILSEVTKLAMMNGELLEKVLGGR